MNLSIKSLLRTLQAKFFPSRLKASYLLAISVVITILYCFYAYRFLTQFVDRTSVLSSHKCEVSSEQRQRLFQLLKLVKEVLETLKITYFLCYLSLWGAIRESGPLPWSTSAELCVLGSNLASIDEASLFRVFRRHNLELTYNSAEGEYSVTSSTDEKSCYVKLILFESDVKVGSMLKRVGWKRRLLPPDCDGQPALQCFPSNLINPPLPIRSFGPLDIPSPREDIDMLKFHYPDTWWKPLKPTC